MLGYSEEKIITIKNYLLRFCLVSGAISFLGLFFSIENQEMLDFWTNLSLLLTYLYLLLITVLLVGFGAYGLIKNYQKNKTLLYGLGGILVLWIVAYLMGSDDLPLASPRLLDQLQSSYGADLSSMVKKVDAGLYLTYFLLLGVILAMLSKSLGILKLFAKK